MKEEIIERLTKSEKENGKITTYIVATDVCFAVNGKTTSLLALLATIIKNLSESGIPKDLLHKAFEVAFEEDDDLETLSKVSKLLKELGDLIGE